MTLHLARSNPILNSVFADAGTDLCLFNIDVSSGVTSPIDFLDRGRQCKFPTPYFLLTIKNPIALNAEIVERIR